MTGQPGLGGRLRKARLALGLAQADLAGDDLSASYVSLIEAGKRLPSPDIIRRLAGRLGIDCEYLASGLAAHDAVQARTDLAFARVALAEGRAEEARMIAAELVSRSPQSLDSGEAYQSRLVMATACERLGQTKQAVALLESLRQQAESTEEDLPWLPVMVALARCYRDAGDGARAVDLAESALTRCRELGLAAVDGHVQLVSTLAGVYADRGDLVRAGLLLDELLETVKDGEAQERGYVYWNAAMTAAEAGHRGEALRLIERAAALIADSDDERNHARLKVARAWIMLNQPEADGTGARQLLRDALPALRRHAGREAVAKAETELARAEIALGRPEVAARHARKALSRLTDEQPLSAARAHAALASSLIAIGDTVSGTDELARAARYLTDAQAPRQAAALWRQLAQAHRALGDTDRAMAALERALDLAGIQNEQLPTARRADEPAGTRPADGSKPLSTSAAGITG